MKIWLSQTNRPWLKQLLITVLAVWVSGASCLMCCGPLEISAAEVENCSAKSSHKESTDELYNDDDCCTENSDSEHSSSNEPCQEECCILNAPASELPGTFKINQMLAMTSPVASLLSFSGTVKTGNIPFSQLHQPEGPKIHLRCCVFLI